MSDVVSGWEDSESGSRSTWRLMDRPLVELRVTESWTPGRWFWGVSVGVTGEDQCGLAATIADAKAAAVGAARAIVEGILTRAKAALAALPPRVAT